MPYTSLFDAFSFAVKLVGLLLVEGVLIFCWSLLFFVPGIIAFYRYSFAVWNLCSNPELGVLQALSLSQQQTRGYKMQLFLLHLSFLLWFLPVIAANVAAELFVWPFVPDTFAVILLVQAISYVLSSALLLYVMPYYTLCECSFYLHATAPVEKEEGEAPFLPDM